MSSAPEDNSNDSLGSTLERDDEFAQVVFDGRNLLKNSKEFQKDDWAWTTELDDGGVFIFSYLLYDYKQQVLSLSRLKESVYMLNVLRHKMLPAQEKSGLTLLQEFQVIFTLYERLKLEEMSWDACEGYLTEQITKHRKTN
ncbi:MAG: hypothetical protein H8E67_05360 [Proteobacteria bacterium]|jgi:hypothetical protein|nr:hypothetical protein [Pseudomonadota bacterium]MBT5794472.1 hypothetical protein [Deltaproteobacteria bacterium]MDB3918173.1 hypothetical protein [bacterium]